MKRICKHCYSEIQIEFHDFPDYDYDLMTIEEFLKHVDDGNLIDYDGTGYYATKDKETDYKFDFEEYKYFGKYDKRFTHILWYNR